MAQPQFQPPATKQNVGVEPGTLTLKLPDGEVLEIVRWIDDQLYGAGELQNGQTEDTIIFSAALSQPIPGGTRKMTQVDTNIPKAGSNGLPEAWEMRVFALSFEFVRASVAVGTNTDLTLTDGNTYISEQASLQTGFDVNRLLFCSYTYNERTYAYGTPLDFPAGLGFESQSNVGGFSSAQNGRPTPRDRRALIIPIRETEGLAYSMTLHPVVALHINQAAILSNNTFNAVDVKVHKIGFVKKNVS